MTQRNRHAPARIAQSKLTMVSAANRNVIDQTSVLYFSGLLDGSKRLCAAILRTGKLHGPMTPEAQIDAVKYAHDITDYAPPPRPRTGPRTVIWGVVK